MTAKLDLDGLDRLCAMLSAELRLRLIPGSQWLADRLTRRVMYPRQELLARGEDPNVVGDLWRTVCHAAESHGEFDAYDIAVDAALNARDAADARLIHPRFVLRIILAAERERVERLARARTKFLGATYLPMRWERTRAAERAVDERAIADESATLDPDAYWTRVACAVGVIAAGCPVTLPADMPWSADTQQAVAELSNAASYDALLEAVEALVPALAEHYKTAIIDQTSPDPQSGDDTGASDEASKRDSNAGDANEPDASAEPAPIGDDADAQDRQPTSSSPSHPSDASDDDATSDVDAAGGGDGTDDSDEDADAAGDPAAESPEAASETEGAGAGSAPDGAESNNDATTNADAGETPHEDASSSSDAPDTAATSAVDGAEQSATTRPRPMPEAVREALEALIDEIANERVAIDFANANPEASADEAEAIGAGVSASTFDAALAPSGHTAPPWNALARSAANAIAAIQRVLLANFAETDVGELNAHPTSGQINIRTFAKPEQEQRDPFRRRSLPGEVGATLILVVDRSGSMGASTEAPEQPDVFGTNVTQRWQLAMQAAVAISTAVERIPGVSLGIIAFDSTYDVALAQADRVPLQERARILNTFLPRGGTVLADAYQRACDLVIARGEPGLVVILTDGDVSDEESSIRRIQAKHEKQIKTVAMTLGYPADGAQRVLGERNAAEVTSATLAPTLARFMRGFFSRN
jgi:hypothetical protein